MLKMKRAALIKIEYELDDRPRFATVPYEEIERALGTAKRYKEVSKNEYKIESRQERLGKNLIYKLTIMETYLIGEDGSFEKEST